MEANFRDIANAQHADFEGALARANADTPEILNPLISGSNANCRMERSAHEAVQLVIQLRRSGKVTFESGRAA